MSSHQCGKGLSQAQSQGLPGKWQMLPRLFWLLLAIWQPSMGRSRGESKSILFPTWPNTGAPVITSSNKDMVLPVGDLWDRPNLEPQVPGRGSLRLPELTPTPPTQSYHCFLPEALISLPIHQQPLVAKWYTATLQGSFTSSW